MRDKPRVVLFRHAPIDIDSRVKKFARTLFRAGYEPIMISLEPIGGVSGEYLLGGDIRVIRVPIEVASSAAEPTIESVNKAARQRLYRERTALRAGITGVNVKSVVNATRLAWASVRTALWKGAQAGTEAAHTVSRQLQHRQADDPFVVADVERKLPVVTNVTHTLVPLLVDLQPDVLHAHHPQVMLAAREALRELQAQGHKPALYYDAREDFSGIPEAERGHIPAFEATIASEKAMIGQAGAVSTVSEPIADVLKDNYSLRERPSVFLNMPPISELHGETDVREAAGLDDDVRIVVYSGTMSWARGIETIIQGLQYMPSDVHLVIVSVPLPHPMIPKLESMAEDLGVLERLHFIAPVNQDELLHYLAGADLAVHPLPGGSPNHDAAMPNKLFEYLHAGLPLVVSDAKLMAKFVTDHGVGRVFVSEDAKSFGRTVTEALAAPMADKVKEVATTYSWQAQEPGIVTLYNKLTGFSGRIPQLDEPFGSLEVTEA